MIEELFDTDERRDLRSTVRRFIEKEVVAHLDAWETDGFIPRELHRKAGQQGLLGIGYAEEVGGSGGDLIDKVVMWEEIMSAGASSGLMIGLFNHEIAVPHIVKAGDPDLIDRWVRPTLAGELIGSLGVTEPHAGSDVATLRTTATREGDEYVVNGSKIYITSGHRADFVTTAVRTGGPGAKGISLLVVDTTSPGFSRGRKLDKMGWRCSDTAELFYDDVRVPASNLVGSEGGGFTALMSNFQTERIWLAVAAYGTAQRCLDLTATSLRNRSAFGGPLIANAALQHRLVAMAQRIAVARTFVREAATLLKADPAVDATVAMAKNVATEACTFVTEEAVRLHGGMGFMRESEVERHYRDAPVLAIGGGAADLMTSLAAKRLGYSA